MHWNPDTNGANGRTSPSARGSSANDGTPALRGRRLHHGRRPRPAGPRPLRPTATAPPRSVRRSSTVPSRCTRRRPPHRDDRPTASTRSPGPAVTTPTAARSPTASTAATTSTPQPRPHDHRRVVALDPSDDALRRHGVRPAPPPPTGSQVTDGSRRPEHRFTAVSALVIATASRRSTRPWSRLGRLTPTGASPTLARPVGRHLRATTSHAGNSGAASCRGAPAPLGDAAVDLDGATGFVTSAAAGRPPRRSPSRCGSGPHSIAAASLLAVRPTSRPGTAPSPTGP